MVAALCQNQNPPPSARPPRISGGATATLPTLILQLSNTTAPRPRCNPKPVSRARAPRSTVHAHRRAYLLCKACNAGAPYWGGRTTNRCAISAPHPTPSGLGGPERPQHRASPPGPRAHRAQAPRRHACCLHAARGVRSGRAGRARAAPRRAALPAPARLREILRVAQRAVSQRTERHGAAAGAGQRRGRARTLCIMAFSKMNLPSLYFCCSSNACTCAQARPIKSATIMSVVA